MKKTLFIGILCAFATQFSAQGVLDAYRLADGRVVGTARYTSMGGSVGALGADMSVTNSNPAGLGVFRKSVFAFTPSLLNNSTESTYFETTNKGVGYNLKIDNLGYVGVMDGVGDWDKLVVSLTYNKQQDYNRSAIITNNQSMQSLTDGYWQFVNTQGGINDNDIHELLAFDVGLIYWDSAGGFFTSDIEESGSPLLDLEKNTTQRGYKGEYALSFASNYKNLLYLGATVGIHTHRFNSKTVHTESVLNESVPFLSGYTFNRYYQEEGNGINLKLGAIYRPVDFLRVGVSVHTPTFYAVTATAYADAEVDYFDNPFDEPSTDPAIVSDESDRLEADYKLTSPFKASAQVGLVIAKRGLISAEYDFVDYGQMRLSADDYSYVNENNFILENYGATHNMRIGGEVRLSDIFSLRAGYAFYQSPLKDKLETDAVKIVSAGFGINQDNMFLDFGVQRQSSNDNEHVLTFNGVDQVADQSLSNLRMMLTLGFRF